MADEDVSIEEAKTLEDAGAAAFDRINADKNAPTSEPGKEPSKAAELKEPEPQPTDKVPGDKGNGKGPELDEKTLSDMKEGKLIPKWRMDEILERLRAYESFGAPEELRARIENLSKATEPKAREPAAELSDEEKETRDFIYKIAPELKESSELKKVLSELSESVKQMREDRKKEAERLEKIESKSLEDHNSKASDMIRNLAKESGYDIKLDDASNLKLIVNAVADIIHSDPGLMDKYYNARDLSVVKIAFDEFAKRMFSGVQRKAKQEILQDKKKQEQVLSPPSKQGGAAPTAPDDTAKMSLDDIGLSVWDRMKQGS